MLIDFLLALRAAGIPVSLSEFLMLLQALRAGLGDAGLDGMYRIARLTLVKDERYFDKFDRTFAAYFQGRAAELAALPAIAADWLEQRLTRTLSDAEKAQLQRLGGLEALRERLRRLSEEQDAPHTGGSKWIGTGGTSPFGNGGVHPEGLRLGGESGGGRSALKVWAQRGYRDYDDEVALGTRNMKQALRRLRRFAREGAAEEFDLDGTVRGTADNAGWLDIRMRAQRRNRVKVLMLLDVGGSMDSHIEQVARLFSAARSEFRQLEFFYFHNCVYDHLWRNNHRRHAQRQPTWDLLRRFTPDYRLIFVGDATMAPYEITQPGGSVEYDNAESGATWLRRLCERFPAHVWINPEPAALWPYRQSVSLISQLLDARMFALTLKGLDEAMSILSRR